MQTFNPELTRHMDARHEQRELAARWRIARAGRTSAARRRTRAQGPVTTGSAVVVRPC